ncbi:hypothetical protein ACIRNY_03040 [Capnocytophaga canimorsus]|uniref:hypothetical protein n=1 Tax=Capnocytophaga canimorsus TaxID=28188 RepID=UPI00384B9F2A
MQNYFSIILAILMFQGYNPSQNQEVSVSLRKVNDMQGDLHIVNHLREDIVVNKFILSVNVLIFELQTDTGYIKKISGTPPPMPPSNLEAYDVVLKQNEAITISLHFPSSKNKDKTKVKLRAKIPYKTRICQNEKIAYSDWIFL